MTYDKLIISAEDEEYRFGIMRGLSSETGSHGTEPKTELVELTKLQAKVIELMDLVMEQGKEISEHQHDLSEADEVKFAENYANKTDKFVYFVVHQGVAQLWCDSVPKCASAVVIAFHVLNVSYATCRMSVHTM
jgi:hypothetical protein